MNLRIEKAAPEDIPNLVGLIREFAEFEKLSEWCKVGENDLREAIFGADAFVEALVAFADKSCVGYALFYPVFKSFRGERSMFLEDLYVSPPMRGKGFGLKMLRETFWLIYDYTIRELRREITEQVFVPEKTNCFRFSKTCGNYEYNGGDPNETL